MYRNKMISNSKLATRLNVSNTAVLQHFYKLNTEIKRHSKVKRNKRYYDTFAVSIIIKSFSNNSNYHKQNNKHIYYTYQKHIKDLHKELQDKQTSINTLHKLLFHQQELQLNSQRELKRTQTQLKLTQKMKSHGIIWNFFHSL